MAAYNVSKTTLIRPETKTPKPLPKPSPLVLESVDEVEHGAVIRTSASRLETKKGPTLRGKPTRGRRRKRGIARKGGAPLLPPELSVVSHTVQRLRFVVGASPGSSNIVTYARMLSSMGCICDVKDSTMQTIHSTFRLRKVWLWPSVNTAAGANSLPEVEFLGGGTTEVARDASFNKTIPAGVTADPGPIVHTPPLNTLAGDWIYPAASSSQELLHFLNMTQGTVIDILVEGTMRNNLSGISQSISAGTLGAEYWGYLDTGAKFQPVGRPSTN